MISTFSKRMNQAAREHTISPWKIHAYITKQIMYKPLELDSMVPGGETVQEFLK